IGERVGVATVRIQRDRADLRELEFRSPDFLARGVAGDDAALGLDVLEVQAAVGSHRGGLALVNGDLTRGDIEGCRRAWASKFCQVATANRVFRDDLETAPGRDEGEGL